MANVILEVSTYWHQRDGECEPCDVCGDMIVAKAFDLRLKVGEKDVSGGVTLCNPCYDLIKKDGIS